MPLAIEREADDIFVIRASGKLVKEDFTHFTPRFEEITREHGKLRVLFDMTGLDGWAPEGMLAEAKFDLQHNGDIRRMAVMGEEKWHHALISVLKPLAHAEVKYFQLGEAEQARTWLLTPQQG